MVKKIDPELRKLWSCFTKRGVDLYGKLFSCMGAKPIVGRLDEVEINEEIVNRMYDIGKAHMHENFPATLDVFQIECMDFSWDGELYEMLQPLRPYRDDMCIYGFTATFVKAQFDSEENLAVSIHLMDANESSAGSTDVATLQLILCKEGVMVLPIAIEEDALLVTDFETLILFGEWLGYVWKGIQYSMLHKPEVYHIRQYRIPKEEIETLKKKTCVTDRSRVVKVQRVITIIDDGESEISIKRGGRTMTLPVWSVAGYWRTYKSGKRYGLDLITKGKTETRERNFVTKHTDS